MVLIISINQVDSWNKYIDAIGLGGVCLQNDTNVCQLHTWSPCWFIKWDLNDWGQEWSFHRWATLDDLEKWWLRSWRCRTLYTQCYSLCCNISTMVTKILFSFFCGKLFMTNECFAAHPFWALRHLKTNIDLSLWSLE